MDFKQIRTQKAILHESEYQRKFGAQRTEYTNVQHALKDRSSSSRIVERSRCSSAGSDAMSETSGEEHCQNCAHPPPSGQFEDKQLKCEHNLLDFLNVDRFSSIRHHSFDCLDPKFISGRSNSSTTYWDNNCDPFLRTIYAILKVHARSAGRHSDATLFLMANFQFAVCLTTMC